MVHWPYWPSPPFHWLYIKLPRSPFTSPTAGCRLCMSLPSCGIPDLWRSFTSTSCQHDADGRTAMPALRAPIQPGWRGSHFTHFIAAGFQIDNAFFPASRFYSRNKIARNVGIHFDASGFGRKLLIPAAASGPLTAALNTATAKTCIRDIVNSVSKRARNVANEGAGCNQSDQKVSNSDGYFQPPADRRSERSGRWPRREPPGYGDGR